MMEKYFQDLENWEDEFHTNNCDCEGVSEFAFDRTVSNGQVWHCKKHNQEIMTSEKPNEDNY